ncbi:MAG: nickel-dependent hydrogenase large subunit [Xanthomonadaceae bacterium]|nr:nickel-dependent hydrogenase large subunit [Xanthomonadaceae bacterium]
MSERIVVDPITRIEGHLRIEAETSDDGVIQQASSSGTMVRGIEIILQGRDPRDAWAFAQRICGVCTLVHGLASVRAVEDALDYPIPHNAQLIRNLMIAGQYVHDHVMHFYHLLGIFSNGYWGHPAYKLPPEANLMAVAHYLDALAWQRDAAKLLTIFGGKNPHPNFLVGGSPSPISIHPGHEGRGKGPHYRGGGGATALNLTGLQKVQNIIHSMRDFVDQVYVPDTLAIAGFYKDWATQGEGIGNFMTYGDFPDKDMADIDSFLVPRGVILDRDLSRVHEMDLNADDQIQEFVSHSWYDYEAGQDAGLHPYQGETKLNYTGPRPPYEYLKTDERYSWMKSPRWRGKPMEVGPLARMLMLHATGHEQAQELVGMTLKTLDLPVEALFSTLGRTAARTLETKIMVDAMQGWYDQLVTNIRAGVLDTFNDQKWEPSSWPKSCQGVGFMEAPRGALAHWVVIKNGLIDNYQAVVPSTWNAGPRDSEGQDGPYEAALKGHRLHDAKQPIEILRTIHSFDPCIACAVHVSDAEGEELVQVKVC